MTDYLLLPPNPSRLQGRRQGHPPTRKSRGSLGRSLNPLGTLVHSVSGRGPNSDWRCAFDRSLRRCGPKTADGPKTASPRLREVLANRETRRSDYRSTIPKDPRPIFRPSSVPSVSQWHRVPAPRFSKRLSPPRTLRPGPPPGFPFGVRGKVDPRSVRGNSRACLFFADHRSLSRLP